MKTDATSGISGAAGTPLSHQATQSGRDIIKKNSSPLESSEAISDTLETTDREGDGRQPLQQKLNSTQAEPNSENTPGLDVTG